MRHNQIRNYHIISYGRHSWNTTTSRHRRKCNSEQTMDVRLKFHVNLRTRPTADGVSQGISNFKRATRPAQGFITYVYRLIRSTLLAVVNWPEILTSEKLSLKARRTIIASGARECAVALLTRLRALNFDRSNRGLVRREGNTLKK